MESDMLHPISEDTKIKDAIDGSLICDLEFQSKQPWHCPPVLHAKLKLCGLSFKFITKFSLKKYKKWTLVEMDQLLIGTILFKIMVDPCLFC